MKHTLMSRIFQECWAYSGQRVEEDLDHEKAGNHWPSKPPVRVGVESLVVLTIWLPSSGADKSWWLGRSGRS